jgi:uncharacterized membrane protein YciS (DUF1049 family)
MDLTLTILFGVVGLFLVTIIIVVGVYSYRLEKANRRIKYLENQIKDLRREKESVEDRLNYVRKYYALKERSIK